MRCDDMYPVNNTYEREHNLCKYNYKIMFEEVTYLFDMRIYLNWFNGILFATQMEETKRYLYGILCKCWCGNVRYLDLVG